MQKNNIKYKAIICCCLFLSACCAAAQNPSHYKYMITPFDSTVWTENVDVLELNNRYYLLTSGVMIRSWELADDSTRRCTQRIGAVTVFDENFNQIKQLQLLAEHNINSTAFSFFYEQDTFYVFGFYMLPMSNPLWSEYYFAKFDKDFNLVQPLTTFPYHGSGENYSMGGILKTKKNEFIFQLYNLEDSSRLIHINNKGDILQDVLINSIIDGTILEMDSNYAIVFGIATGIGIFNKDSLNKYKYVVPEIHQRDVPTRTGVSIVVNNQIIRSYDRSTSYKECPKDMYGYPVSEYDRSILFFDDDFKLKDSLIFGNHCVLDWEGHRSMDYINPDSIYYAYKTYGTNAQAGGNTVSIANFSWDGKLNFNYTLDLPGDSGVFRHISFCKALSNGGVLIGGSEDGDLFGSISRKNYLLYFHPTKNVGIVETRHAASLPQIFPNPARSQFTATNVEKANLYLYNIVGQEVLQIYSKEDNIIVNIGSLPQGVYVLKVVKEGSISVHKIIISD